MGKLDKILRVNVSFITSVTAIGVATLAVADEMWAVDAGSDNLYLWDSDTGRTKYVIGPLNPSPTRFLTPVSMAVSGRGAIYVQNNSPSGDRGLSSVDPRTGRATYIGPGLGIDGSLSFGPGGRLYGFDDLNRLGTVSLTTGAVTRVPGAPRSPVIYGMDYCPDEDRFLAITSAGGGTTPDLIRIDPSTGFVVGFLDTGILMDNVPRGLAFDVDGNLVLTEIPGIVHILNPDTGRPIRTYRGTTPTPQGLGLACRGDFNRSGNINFLDFLSFQNAFDTGDLSADYDYDGQLTIFDFLEFQNAFNEGCR